MAVIRGCLAIIGFIIILHTIWLLQTNFKYPPEHSSTWKSLLQVMTLEPNAFWHVLFMFLRYTKYPRNMIMMYFERDCILFCLALPRLFTILLNHVTDSSTAMGLCMGYSTSQPSALKLPHSWSFLSLLWISHSVLISFQF